MDDLFSSCIGLEDEHLATGEAEGIRAGERIGFQEGRAEGLARGFDFGAEVGYYEGCVLVWCHVSEKFPSAFTERTRKGILALRKQVVLVAGLGPEDQEIQAEMEKLQNKFKAVKSMIGAQNEHLTGAKAPDLSF